MIQLEKHGILISPTNNDFENNGTFNPGVYQEENKVKILYRATDHDNYSVIGYAETDGPIKITDRKTTPYIERSLPYERQGVEDPRIVRIEDKFYVTYTAYDGLNAMGAVAVSDDLVDFEKIGIVTPMLNYEEYGQCIKKCDKDKLNPKYNEYYDLFAGVGVAEDRKILLRDKDVVLYPKKIQGKFAMLHRIWPGIQIAYFDDWEDLTTEYWVDHLENLTDNILMDPKHDFEISYIGAGCPPIETSDGWLLIYHGVQETVKGKVYHTGAALFHLDQPQIEISRLKEPLFSPTKQWEKTGVVNNVVFPTGTALFDSELYIYYGAADRHVAAVSVNIDELLHEIKKES